MTATSVTGIGPGDSAKRIAYLSSKLPKELVTQTTSNPQDLITRPNSSGGGGSITTCDPIDGEGYQSIDLQCCRQNDTQIASGDNAFIGVGCNNTASGTMSAAVGYDNQAIGIASFAEGAHNRSLALGSHAEGGHNNAYALYSHAEGKYNNANAPYSHVEGYETNANSYASHAEGRQTLASGPYSHAEGRFTIATGYASHAEGLSTQAGAKAAHSEGYRTAAYGIYSHAEGNYSAALGNWSSAGGQYSVARLTGMAARANGIFRAAGDAQQTATVMRVEVLDATPTELTLDGGTASGTTNRFVLQTNSSNHVIVRVVARNTADSAVFTRYLEIDNTGGTVTIAGAVQTLGTDKGSNAGAPPVGWTVTITASSITQSMIITVAGDGSVISWVAFVETVEVVVPGGGGA